MLGSVIRQCYPLPRILGVLPNRYLPASMMLTLRNRTSLFLHRVLIDMCVRCTVGTIRLTSHRSEHRQTHLLQTTHHF